MAKSIGFVIGPPSKHFFFFCLAFGKVCVKRRGLGAPFLIYIQKPRIKTINLLNPNENFFTRIQHLFTFFSRDLIWLQKVDYFS